MYKFQHFVTELKSESKRIYFGELTHTHVKYIYNIYV